MPRTTEAGGKLAKIPQLVMVHQFFTPDDDQFSIEQREWRWDQKQRLLGRPRGEPVALLPASNVLTMWAYLPPLNLGLALPRLIAALPIFVDLVACPQMPFGRWAL